MANSIDDIFKACENAYGIELNAEEGGKYFKFLKRQLDAHPEYNLNKRNAKGTTNPFPDLNLLRNKLLLFSYLIGETSIIAGYKDHEIKRRIGWYSPGDKRQDGSIATEWELKPKEERKKDIYLLRRCEMGLTASPGLDPFEQSQRRALRQTDKNLLSIQTGFTSFHTRYKYPHSNWGGVIDELGEDEEVVEYFGQKITYEMVKKCHSPNPLTFDHGGYRWGKRKGHKA